MTLFERIKEARTEAIKTENQAFKSAVRMVLGEIPRLNKKAGEIPSDSEIIKIINGLIKSERLTVKYSGQDSSEYLEILESFLPQKISEAEIKSFIDTIDISSLKNKNQIIGIVKNHFGADVIEVNSVKKIIENL